MFCTKCGAAVATAARFCPQCGSALVLNAQPIEPQIAVLQVNAASDVVTKVRPWVRYWARMIDIFSFSFVFGTLLVYLFHAPIFKNENEQLLSIFILFVYVFVEAFLLSSFGTTPGKWLFKIKLAHTSGKPATYSQALDRSIKVWWRGLGMGLPLVSLFTLIIAYGNLKKNGITSWDSDSNFVVSHEKIGIVRVLIALVFFMACVSLIGIANRT